MADKTPECVTASTTIDAAPEAVFAVLADPSSGARQPSWSGWGTLSEVAGVLGVR